jgi:hypothetical protein
MMASHARRRDRLEATDSHTDEYLKPTDDVLLSIEQRRQTLSFYCPVCVLSENQARIAAIMGDIVSTAAAQRHPDYQSQLEWCRDMWAKRDNATPYEPAVTGGGFGEIQDWDAPNVMQRRAELRASPLVQEILRHGLH